ncbi:MAG TPA: hypothetical protein DD473_20500 [Planctomycetaceae bacterium]|nr:hypothetical protein [Planctomycetaceae bacterium]
MRFELIVGSGTIGNISQLQVISEIGLVLKFAPLYLSGSEMLDHFQMVSAVAWTRIAIKTLCLLLPNAAVNF